jgi:ParB/RepB/Spo0J family partition protein
MPVVVRPLAALRGLAKYELVAGERRYSPRSAPATRTCRRASSSSPTARCSKAQLVENLQREGLDTLAEAAGLQGADRARRHADAIAEMVGKSRSYVYARIKLLELAPPVREALDKGEIDASQALLFARIPTAKLQEQGLNVLRNWSYQGHGERLSFRRCAEILGNKAKGLLIPLASVPWQLDDPNFFRFGPKDRRGAEDAIALPTCSDCPKRSGNDPELLEALGGDANICTDKECHDAKGKQTFERRRKSVEASGQAVLTGDEAAAILPTDYGTRGYVDLDEPCDQDHFPDPEPEDENSPEFNDWHRRDDAWQPRTYRQLLGVEGLEGLEIKLVQDPKHKSRIRELAPDKEVQKRLKARGVKLRLERDTRKPEKPAKEENPEKARQRAEREAADAAAAELDQKVDETTRVRALKAMHAGWKGPLKRDDLELVAEFALEAMNYGDDFDALYPKRPSPSTLSERDLGRLLVSIVVCNGLDDYRDNDRPLKAVCKRLKIDLKAIEKAVRAELAPAKEKAPAKKAGKAKGKKK